MAKHPAKCLCEDCEIFRRGDAEATVLTPGAFARVVNTNTQMRDRRDHALPHIAKIRIDNDKLGKSVNRLTASQYGSIPPMPRTVQKEKDSGVVDFTDEQVVDLDVWQQDNPGKNYQDEGWVPSTERRGNQIVNVLSRDLTPGYRTRRTQASTLIKMTETLDTDEFHTGEIPINFLILILILIFSINI